MSLVRLKPAELSKILGYKPIKKREREREGGNFGKFVGYSAIVICYWTNHQPSQSSTCSRESRGLN